MRLHGNSILQPFITSSGAVGVRILAGLVDVEGVVRVLHGRDLDAPSAETRNDLGEQGGFSGTAPAGRHVI